MSIFKRHKWPKHGGHPPAFFRPMPPATNRELDAREPQDAGSSLDTKATATEACGNYIEDKEVPGYCWGCTQPEGTHTAEAIAGPMVEPLLFSPPSRELQETLADIDRVCARLNDLCIFI